jgi:murein L,D-transpeptidase YcbB/YkuD
MMRRMISTTARRVGLIALPLALFTACRMSADKPSGAPETETEEGEVGRAWAPATLTAVKGVPIAALKTAVQARLAGARPETVGDDAWQHTRRLYARFQQAPLWLSDDGLDKDRAGALTNAVLEASKDGLRIDDYPVAEMAQAIANVRTDRPTAEQLAEADVLLTAAYASLGEDLLVGQVEPKSVGQAWHIDPQEENVDSALVRTLSKLPLDKSITAMRPSDEEYAALQKELQRYRDLEAKGGWQPIPAGKPLKRGDSDSPQRIAALRARLEAEGITVASAASAQPAARAGGAVFDDALAAAIAQFQAHHAINVDSALGTETLNSLNVPVAYRLGQIAANLERHRWMPRSLGSRNI